MKEQLKKITSNPIGAAVGGLAGYMAAKKLGKVESMWALGAAALAGVYVGSMIQSKMKAKSSTPTADTVKK